MGETHFENLLKNNELKIFHLSFDGMETASPIIFQSYLDKSMSYSQYRELLDVLLSQGKTTGENQSDSMIGYAELNASRMKKWDKIFHVSDELRSYLYKVEIPQTWLVLTEGWCGDAAQSLPLLAKMADYTESVELKLVLRDESPSLMDAYLTNGSRSIPKLIALRNEDNTELFQWGPRPAPVQKIVMESKDRQIPYSEYSQAVHAWYAKDKGQTLSQEFIEILGGL